MKKIDIVNTAFINFKRRKTRSILTVLGVVIGVTSIVVMISLGLAINKSFDDSMGSISGLTTVNVYGGYDEKTGKQKPLNEETVTMLESLDNIIGVSPEINVSGKFGSGKYVGYADITGVKPEFLEDLGIKLPDDFDMEAFKAGSTKNITCIMGNEVPYQFRNPRKQNNHGGGIMMGGGMMWSEDGETTEREPPEVDVTADNAKVKFTFDWNYGEKPQPGQTVKKAKLYNVKVMHIINQEGYEHSYNAYIPLELAKKLKKEQEKQNDSNGMGNGMGSSNSKDKNVYSQIKVIATDMKHCDAIVNKVKEMGYQAHSMGEYIQQTKQMTNIIQLVLGGIGGISLLVAAIGITNTMIMSIYERTKEIGVMKVIGCQLKDIKSMFLCEASFIGLFGGAIGLLLSYLISFGLNSLTKGGGEMASMIGAAGTKLSIIPPWLAFAGVSFAIFVALLSGYLPAVRATKLSALEALKN